MTNILKNKLKNLENKLTILKTHKSKEMPSKSPTSSGIRYAVTICSELIAGILVGCFIGYYIDNFFLTKPLFFIVFMILGIIGGFWNIIKSFK